MPIIPATQETEVRGWLMVGGRPRKQVRDYLKNKLKQQGVAQVAEYLPSLASMRL
jgi:hypothetical protein